MPTNEKSDEALVDSLERRTYAVAVAYYVPPREDKGAIEAREAKHEAARSALLARFAALRAVEGAARTYRDAARIQEGSPHWLSLGGETLDAALRALDGEEKA